MKEQVVALYPKVGVLVEAGNMKQAIEVIFEFIRSANRYFDEKRPWISINSEIEKCKETLATCVYIIQNLAQLLQPFLPFACAKMQQILGLTLNKWHEQAILPTQLTNVQPLYERIDVKQIEEELAKLIKGQV